MQRIHLERDLALPVARAHAHLAEHENLGPLFGARVTRVRDGDTERNGVGSVRALRVGPLPAFDETVTAFVPGELIEYRITRGGVLRHHRGRMRFSPTAGGTRLTYDVEFGAVVPGLDRLVRRRLERSLGRGLDDVARLG